MCKYCERIHNGQVELLVDQEGFMACISDISPISLRSHPHMKGELHLHHGEVSTSIPINYCPMCGHEIKLN